MMPGTAFYKEILYQHILILKLIAGVSFDLPCAQRRVHRPENEFMAKTVVREELENDTLTGSAMQ